VAENYQTIVISFLIMGVKISRVTKALASSPNFVIQIYKLLCALLIKIYLYLQHKIRNSFSFHLILCLILLILFIHKNILATRINIYLNFQGIVPLGMIMPNSME
jgi:hypothetical protein